ncbi:MAG TPA: paraquat-inducible protein A [Gammaproteobacteria bacterium]|nr:paraquat-inducible protein A [Gammaproteobacteria bacterium]
MKLLFRAAGVTLLLIALAMLAFNLDRPILHVEKFWVFEHSVSIWSGMQALYRADEWLLGSLILVFSIIVPIGKNLLLIAFLFARPWLGRRGDWLVRLLAALGRWSMLDVLIVAVVVVSLRLGAVAQADILSPLYWFVASVLLTNAVSTALDWSLARRQR